MEGISRALRIFNGKEDAPDFIVTPAQEQITVEPTVRSPGHRCVCGALCAVC